MRLRAQTCNYLQVIRHSQMLNRKTRNFNLRGLQMTAVGACTDRQIDGQTDTIHPFIHSLSELKHLRCGSAGVGLGGY